MTPDERVEKIKAIQVILGVLDDGIPGPKTEAAWQFLKVKPSDRQERRGKASSFADPKDVQKYIKCRQEGGSEQECLAKGDNGVGTPSLGIRNSKGNMEGVSTTSPTIPMCALPPEDWKPLGDKAPGAAVEVTCNGKTIMCILRDTMPKKANITNGAVIDLNPGAANALGLKPPFMVDASWRWG